MRNAEYITPMCCDKVKNTKVVRLGLYPGNNNRKGSWKNVKPKWYIIGDDFYRGKHWDKKIEIDKCPFCGEKLPDVILNDEKLSITEGDEEYCDTCGERHMCCDCYPPEYRWKPINK